MGSVVRLTLGAFGLFVIHGELAVRGEEGGVVVVDVRVIGDGVVLFEEVFDGWVGDGVGEIGESGRHDGMMLSRVRGKYSLCSRYDSR